ncbi:host-nuclease inhibitor Gam family protein [Mesorhizobium sp. DCY119]|uniref:host-nuclease inhibitor Gam family protein n=1 Tax=Mesorhizobium sp. DCY119 TaxID=2108445 RepID=UPI000E6BF1DB|nr:host-nuclease inhibitor Gam family protein [Mesorhizobium sp. DCY119]RJG46465.1 nuclease inhibitor protein [Mesorhizobium sp. DCY119]
MAKAKAKAKALIRVPQSREDAVWTVGRIGTLRRDIAARKAAADEQIRTVGEMVEAALAPLAQELAQLEEGMQAYCEVNRLSLTNEGKVKFHDFGTGRISWRLRPPKVGIRGMEAVIEGCKRLGLSRFLRVKEEINRDAMLADADTARQIAGVTISSEGEDFVIEPAELETAVG